MTQRSWTDVLSFRCAFNTLIYKHWPNTPQLAFSGWIKFKHKMCTPKRAQPFQCSFEKSKWSTWDDFLQVILPTDLQTPKQRCTLPKFKIYRLETPKMTPNLKPEIYFPGPSLLSMHLRNFQDVFMTQMLPKGQRRTIAGQTSTAGNQFFLAAFCCVKKKW